MSDTPGRVMTVRTLWSDGTSAPGLGKADLPVPAAGELRVRILACGVSESEAARWGAGRHGPRYFGWQPVGVVESVGRPGSDASVPLFDTETPTRPPSVPPSATSPAAHPFVAPPAAKPPRTPPAPGTRVHLHHSVGCGRCGFCTTGREVHCEARRHPAYLPGGLGEGVLVNPVGARGVVPLPEGLGEAEATLVEPLACVLRAWRRAGFGLPASWEVGTPPAGPFARVPESVTVVGLSVMGLLHVAVAAAAGVPRVVAMDAVPIRLKQAARLGAGSVVNVVTEEAVPRHRLLTGGAGAELVVVIPGTHPALEVAAACVAEGGVIVPFGALPAGEAWPLRQHDLFAREVRIAHSRSSDPSDAARAARVLAGPLREAAGTLVTHRVPLSQWERAFRLAAESAEAMQVVVVPD